MSEARVYLDHNAAAPLRRGVREAMLEWLGPAANPSSAHREGARARQAIEAARRQVANLIGAAPADVVFTSGATEANNLALRGTLGTGGQPAAIVTTAIEHASVLETARALVGETGPPLELVTPDVDGQIEAAAVLAKVRSTVRLVSVGLANGEVGTIMPIAEIARGLRDRGVVFHTDAAQAAGRLVIDVSTLGVDLLSLSSPKLGGPAGVGALWVRPGTSLRAQVTGGPQERGRRAGTEHVAGIVGFGLAAEGAARQMPGDIPRLTGLTEQLWEALRERIPGVIRNGPPGGPRLPNTLNISVPGCAGESLLVLLDLEGIAASLGSACAAGSVEPSHVLLAMGRSPEVARSSLRLSLGADTSVSDVRRVSETLPRLVAAVRGRAAA